MPAKVKPFAALVILIVPPTIFNSAFVRTLIPVPAVALITPPLLSTLTICVELEDNAIPAVVLLMVPLFATSIVAVPVLVADIPVTDVMLPAALFSNRILPLPACEAEIPAVAALIAAPELI
ncbi:Uncharacterised protein [Yersinia aldovae]|uniref:Uncharacterized protein n=1 Tax=Yersinia aldovae TaxID=29483 RepID=A0A0T9TJ54_YERAL|nr:Uncharacterised protein [Yersinia aldovae]CNK86309.1 Uncharacterised protein [Yersinia aldovae]CNL34818.1 Uncharacterised protein [Yersinia aldovae]